MRRSPDHPRPWSEIQPTLDPEEQRQFLAFAADRGFALEIATAEEAERLLLEWRTAGSPETV